MNPPIHPYLFPGITGTMERPFPSVYPLPMDVLVVCCTVFETYGRFCDAYRSASGRPGAVLTPDIVLYRQVRNPMAMDIRKMAVMIIIEHTRWKPSARAHLEEYTHRFIARFFNMAGSLITYQLQRAQDLLRSDSCFRHLYFICLEQLMCSFRLELSRDRLEELRVRAA